MADTVKKTIDIIFNGTDKVSSVIKNIGDNIDTASDGFKDFGAPFEDMVQAIGVAQLAVAGLATAAGLGAAALEKETQRMTIALGLPAEEAEKFADIAKDAYSGNFTDDLSSAFEAVILAQQKFGENSDTDIGKVVENAGKLEKIFGVDVNESMNAVSVLMKDFGIDADEAFNLIANGYQKGLDGSGDFIQSITEYSSQFSNGQATASEFFSIMESGYSEGFLGADKAADAFKEFRVRIQDGSKLTADSLALIGIDNAELQKNLQSGETTVFEAFNNIIAKIGETDNKQTQMVAGVGLIGTQFEDLGLKAVLALDGTKVKIEEINDTMNNITFDDFESNMTTAWRRAITAVIDAPMWGEIGLKVSDVAEEVSESFVVSFEKYDFKELLTKFDDLWEEIGSIFVDADIDLTTIDGMTNALDIAVESIGSLIDITKGQIDVIKPVVTAVVEIMQQFNDMDSDTKELIGSITLLGSGFATLGGVLAIGSPILSGMGTLLTLISGPVGLTVALAGLAVSIATWADDFEPLPDDFFTKPKDILNEFKEDIELFPTEIKTKLSMAVDSGASTQEVLEIVQEGLTETDLHFEAVFGESGLTEIKEDLYEIPDERPVMVKVNGEWAELDTLEQKLDDLEDKQVDVGVDIDSNDVSKAKETIEVLVGEGADARIVSIDVEANGLDETKKEIDDIPSEKILEIKLQGDIDTTIAGIESSAKTAQTAFEWKAKVDISEAQANADIITGAYESIGTVVQSSSDVISDSLSALGDWEVGVDSIQDKWRAQDLIEDQMDLQQQALDLQKKLTDAQIEYMEAKTKAIEDGESAITIDSSGLEPALEMIMWQIIEKVQLRATEEAQSFLLGI